MQTSIARLKSTLWRHWIRSDCADKFTVQLCGHAFRPACLRVCAHAIRTDQCLLCKTLLGSWQCSVWTPQDFSHPRHFFCDLVSSCCRRELLAIYAVASPSGRTQICLLLHLYEIQIPVLTDGVTVHVNCGIRNPGHGRQAEVQHATRPCCELPTLAWNLSLLCE